MQPRVAERVTRRGGRQIHVQHHRFGDLVWRRRQDVLEQVGDQAPGGLRRGLTPLLDRMLDVVPDGFVVDVHEQDRVAAAHEQVAAELERRLQHFSVRLADERRFDDGNANEHQHEGADQEGDGRPHPVEADLDRNLVRRTQDPPHDRVQ